MDGPYDPVGVWANLIVVVQGFMSLLLTALLTVCRCKRRLISFIPNLERRIESTIEVTCGDYFVRLHKRAYSYCTPSQFSVVCDIFAD